MQTTRQIQTARQFLFLQRWTMARERLLRAIDGLSQTVICKEPVIGDWTVKDILGHVVTWNDEIRGQIQVILNKEDSPYSQFISTEKDFADWNQPRIAKKRKWSWKRIRADIDRDYEEGVELILNLKPSEFRHYGLTPWAIMPPRKMGRENYQKIEPVETLITYHWRHMNFHSRLIEKWRKKRESNESIRPDRSHLHRS
jgi:hypothetical protein